MTQTIGLAIPVPARAARRSKFSSPTRAALARARVHACRGGARGGGREGSENLGRAPCTRRRL